MSTFVFNTKLPHATLTGLNLVKFELHINDVKTREEVKKDTK